MTEMSTRIETEHYIIRDVCFSDYESFAVWEVDPDMTRYFALDRDRTYEDVVTEGFAYRLEAIEMERLLQIVASQHHHDDVDRFVGIQTGLQITESVLPAFDRVIDKECPIRRFGISANHVLPDEGPQQLSFFQTATDQEKEVDRKSQEAMLSIKDKYGKNAIFKSDDLREEATQLERNRFIGGHRA